MVESLLLLISISLSVSLLFSAIFRNISLIRQCCLPVLVCILSFFFFSDFFDCDSSGSVSLPERVHQMPRRRLQLECFSKRSGYVGGIDLTHSLFLLPCLIFRAFCSMLKNTSGLFQKSFVIMRIYQKCSLGLRNG